MSTLAGRLRKIVKFLHFAPRWKTTNNYKFFYFIFIWGLFDAIHQIFGLLPLPRSSSAVSFSIQHHTQYPRVFFNPVFGLARLLLGSRFVTDRIGWVGPLPSTCVPGPLKSTTVERVLQPSVSH